MRIHSPHATARRDRRSRAGVVYVEHLLLLIAGLLIATALVAIAAQSLQPRYARIVDALATSAP